jgi:hypothetical protein
MDHRIKQYTLKSPIIIVANDPFHPPECARFLRESVGGIRLPATEREESVLARTYILSTAFILD